LVLTAPWWLTFFTRHGIGPLLTAFGSRHSEWFLIRPLVVFWFFNFTSAPFLDIVGFLGLAGLLVTLIKRQYFLPVWMLVIVLIEHDALLSLVAIPFSMLAATGLDEGVRGLSWLAAREKNDQETETATRFYPNYSIALVIIFYAWISSYFAFKVPVLSQDDIEAQKWVAQNTSGEARFVLITGTNWWVDNYAEWFPVLAQRTSLATVQGLEWTSSDIFARRIEDYKLLQSCTHAVNMACLDQWQKKSGQPLDYIFIPKKSETDSLDGIKQVVEDSGRYRLIYDGRGAFIFQIKIKGTGE